MIEKPDHLGEVALVVTHLAVAAFGSPFLASKVLSIDGGIHPR